MSKSIVARKLQEACQRRGLTIEPIGKTATVEERKAKIKQASNRLRLNGATRKPMLLGLGEFGE
jgi:hypothetical protein